MFILNMLPDIEIIFVLQNIPKEAVAIREELARIKAERLARRAMKESKDHKQDNL